MHGQGEPEAGEPRARPEQHPLLRLDESDREFVVRMVLASGSLKELARVYGVSYPTIRSRLDQLIGRLRRLLADRPIDPMAELLADLVDRGEVPTATARRILDLHRSRARKEGL